MPGFNCSLLPSSANSPVGDWQGGEEEKEEAHGLIRHPSDLTASRTFAKFEVHRPSETELCGN